MDPKIRVDLQNLKEVIWPIIGIELLRLYGISDKITFLMICGWIAVIIIHLRKIIIPKILGLYIYLLMIVIASIIGLLFYKVRDIERDLYYILPTIAVMLIGYIIEKTRRDKSLRKTIYLMGTMISVYALYTLIRNITAISELSQIRAAVSGGISEVVIIASALFIEKINYKRVIFSKSKDLFMLFVMFAQVAVSFGRTAIGTTILICASGFFAAFLTREDRGRLIQKMSLLLIISVFLLYIIMKIVPTSVSEEFYAKLDNSFNEMSTNEDIDSTSEAMDNWRGYEIQSAQRQWLESNVLEMLFGQGMGTGIKIKYIPFVWERTEVVEDNAIPILHNCYYTILVKAGLLGTLSLIMIYFSGVILLIKFRKHMSDVQCELVVLTAVGIGMAFMGYFTRGIVSQTYCFAWGLIVGSINCQVNSFPFMDMKEITGEEYGVQQN